MKNLVLKWFHSFTHWIHWQTILLQWTTLLLCRATYITSGTSAYTHLRQLFHTPNYRLVYFQKCFISGIGPYSPSKHSIGGPVQRGRGQWCRTLCSDDYGLQGKYTKTYWTEASNWNNSYHNNEKCSFILFKTPSYPNSPSSALVNSSSWKVKWINKWKLILN